MDNQQPMAPSEAASLQDAIVYTTWEQIEELRRRLREGDVLSPEEYRAGIAFFRASRTAAVGAAPKGKRVSATAEATKALESLLGL